MTHFCVGRPTGRAGGEGEGGFKQNAQVQKTQAKRAFFELVHFVAGPGLIGFPGPPALTGPTNEIFPLLPLLLADLPHPPVGRPTQK